MNDRIQLKEWPRFDGEAYLLGQKFTGRVICENTRTESDISLSFRAIETLDTKEATGTSKRRNVIFQSVQRADRRAAALETRDRIEWWFGITTPLVCDKSYNLSELGLAQDARYSSGAQTSALPPSFPAKTGASVEYEFVLEVNRANPYGQRILRCALPFVTAEATTASSSTAPVIPAAVPLPPSPSSSTTSIDADPSHRKVSVADGVRARGRFTLERQFRTLLPDDPELQVPSRRFDASLFIPNAALAGKPTSFQVAVKHLGIASDTLEENVPTFRLAQLRLEIRGTTVHRVRNDLGQVENKSTRGAWRRFDWRSDGETLLPSDGQPVTIGSVVKIPSYSKDTTFIPDFRTLAISHSHELKADIYVQHVETGHFFSFESDDTYPVTVAPGQGIDEEVEVNGNGSANSSKANGAPARGENSLVLEDISPPPAVSVRRASTYESISSQSQSRKSWGRRFSIRGLNSWRKSTDALSQLVAAADKPSKR